MKRAVGYVRESTEEQGENWAPHVQRKAIEAYARDNELELVATFQDFVSGRNAGKRPDFQRLLSEAAERRFEAVLVYHSSRFARNVYEARQYKEYLRKRLGIEVISVTQRFGEQDDPSAFLMEGLNEVLDEHYSRNLGFLISAGLREKESRGYLPGNLPFGYRRPPGDTRRALPHPDEAPVVREVFERYAQGSSSYTAIADWLNARGLRARRGHAFSKWAVEEILRNVAYAGYIGRHRAGLDESRPGSHEPIITPELFEKVQAQRQRRFGTKHTTRPSRHRYLLSGTALCARCGGKLYGSRGGNGNRFARYLCRSRTSERRCDQPQALARTVETQLGEFLGDFRLDDAHVDAAMATLRRRNDPNHGRPSNGSSGELRSRLARLKDLYELGDLSRGEYLKRKTKVAAILADMEPMPSLEVDRCVNWLRDFADLWAQESDAAAKQEFVRLAFERIVIDDKRIVAVKPRPDVLPLFTEHSKVHRVDGGSSPGGETSADTSTRNGQGAHSRGDWI